MGHRQGSPARQQIQLQPLRKHHSRPRIQNSSIYSSVRFEQIISIERTQLRFCVSWCPRDVMFWAKPDPRQRPHPRLPLGLAFYILSTHSPHLPSSTFIIKNPIHLTSSRRYLSASHKVVVSLRSPQFSSSTSQQQQSHNNNSKETNNNKAPVDSGSCNDNR